MYRFIKRGLDFGSSSLLFVAISPVFLILALLVRVRLGAPIFYCQIRSGRDKKPFKLIKFRSMTNDKDSAGRLLPDAQRLTSFGHWLRSSSLDELPELINIIKGDMSVIGPRPLPPKYDAYYTERELKRFQVRGGLISPESIDKDPFISWDKQLEYDASYAENLSFKEDLKVFYLVFRMLFFRYERDLGGWIRDGLDVERVNMFQNEEGISNSTPS